MKENIETSKRFRIAVHKSNRYLTAQIVDDEKRITLISVNSKESKSKTKSEQAIKAAEIIASKAQQMGITKLYLDSRNNRYQGRIKFFCETLRKNKMEI